MRAKILMMAVVAAWILACGDNPTTPAGGGGGGDTEVAPKSGTWAATTDFGGLEFVVSSDSKTITEIKYTFSGWKGKSGSIKIGNSSGWQISSRQFEIKNDLDPDPLRTETWTIKGTFHTNGKQATGTWNATISGATFSGNWQGAPKS
jgi:hypothetical protein